MALSSELISQFVKITNDSKDKPKTETTLTGTAREVAGKFYVKIDGSDQLTPVTTTAGMKDGDRVTVTIKDHSATVTGNTSSPSASKDDVGFIESDLNEAIDQISEFEIVIAGKVDTEVFNAEKGRIDELVSENITIKEQLTAANADIDNLQAENATITGKLDAAEADIDQLHADMLTADAADLKYATIDNLEATNANIHNLEADYGDFKVLTTEQLTAQDAAIKNLDTEKLSAEQADLKYANIDFANIGKAAIETFFSKSGMIGDLVVGDGTITGHLVGVTISGDLIEGNTIKADKLVVLGEDGLYYKLNVNGESVAAEQTEYNSLNGSVITAKTITAEKVNVNDLVAFDATIGGFKITESSIYSGVKETIDNTTRGIYMDDEGQIAFGDESNYLKYFYDETDSKWKLAISANAIKLGASGKDIETVINDVVEDVKITDRVGPGPIAEYGENAGKKPSEIIIYGKTRQNLWKNPVGTSAGVTSTENEDGSLSFTGTSTLIDTGLIGDINYNLKPGVTYTISTPDTGNIPANFVIAVQYWVDGTAQAITTAGVSSEISSSTFTIPENAEKANCRWYIKNEATVGTIYDFTARIMLNEGETAEPWCPPGLNSVGQLRDHEKNLWHNPASQTINGITYTANADGSISLSGTATDSVTISSESSTLLKPGKTYTASIDNVIAEIYESNNGAGACLYIQYYDTEDSYIGDNPFGYADRDTITFTTPSSLASAYFRINIASGTTVSGTYHVMLNEGSTALPWISPSAKTGLNIVTAGKNLLKSTYSGKAVSGVSAKTNSDGSITVSGTLSGNQAVGLGNIPFDYDLVPGTYFVSLGADIEDDKIYIQLNDGEGNSLGSTNAGGLITVDRVYSSSYWFIGVKAGFSGTVTIRPQLELGSTATEFESPDVTATSINLDGNILASLPDGTRDELRIASDGSVFLTKRVGVTVAPTDAESWVFDSQNNRAYYDFDNSVPITSKTCGYGSILNDTIAPRVGTDPVAPTYSLYYSLVDENNKFERVLAKLYDKTALADIVPVAGGMTTLYPLAEPLTVGLGQVNLPALNEAGGSVWIGSDLNPDLELEYWTKFGEKVADADATANNAQSTVNSVQSDVSEALTSANSAIDRVTTAESSLELLQNSIKSLVTDEDGTSLMTQTSDGWTFNIGGLQSSVEQAANDINEVKGDMSEVNQLAQQTNDLANDIAEKTAYITMTQDANGDPCVELGKQDNPFKVRITNTSIDFMEGTERIAYITNRQLYIQSSVVTDEMKIGATSGFIWKKRGNGNMGLRWEAN